MLGRRTSGGVRGRSRRCNRRSRGTCAADARTGRGSPSVRRYLGHVRDQCIEFLSGRAAERMLLDGEPAVPADDLRQAGELASLICSSEEAVETFIAHCDIAARDLLLPYGDVVIALSTVLRIKRTLDGAEIDALISNVQTLKAQAIERRRRADWRKRELSARNFLAEQIHAGDASLPHAAHDQVARLRE